MPKENFQGGSKDAQKVKSEIKEEILQYGKLEDVQVENVVEDDDSQDYGSWEKATPKVDSLESKRNLESGLLKVEKIISNVKGDLIGAHFSVNFHGYREGSILTLADSDRSWVLNKIAIGSGWYSLYDDDFIYVGKESVDSERLNHLIGDKEVCSHHFSKNTENEPFFYVDGGVVTPQDYQEFMEKVRTLIRRSYHQRGVDAPCIRSFSEEDLLKIKEIRLKNKIQESLKDGEVVMPGLISLRNGPYGNANFGSGYGSLKAYDLVAWREGRLVKKEVATKNSSNGFMSGPVEVTIESNTIVICSGGDDVGTEGRSWKEIYICE
jgi:hypothetical protein